MIWPHASKQHPCPICGKEDWCTFGDKAILCQRVESNHPAKAGGWYHFYEEAKPVNLPPPKRYQPPTNINFENLNEQFQKVMVGNALATLLGVSHAAILSLCAGYSINHQAWTFPMRDGSGKIIGIQLRGESKRCITGSRLGLFIPQCDPQPIVYLPEGASDTAALLSMGLYAIGRPSCNAGNEMICEFIKSKQIRRAVVVADKDEIKAGGKRPGTAGALKLKLQLKIPSVIWFPPNSFKDVRQFLHNGGTKEIIESQVKNKIWS